jgi:hypothetical protein
MIGMWFEGVPRPTSGSAPNPRRRDRSERAARGATFARALGLAAALSASSVAGAQTPEEAARAFDDGIAQLKLGKYETACAALERSHGIEPNLGALIALADCLERWGKIHSASLRYEEFLTAIAGTPSRDGGKRAAQRTYAESALARLAPQVPKLALTLQASGASEVRVVLDDRALAFTPSEAENGAAPRSSEDTGAAAKRALEREVAVDPGHHVIETHAAGHEPWRLELDVEIGQRQRVELALGPAPEARGPALAPEPPRPPQTEPVAPMHRAPGANEPATSPWRTLGWGLGGLGVAGIGVGAVAGVLVLQTCPSFNCDSRAQRGKDLAFVADVGFGVGLAALAASAILLLSTDAPPPRTDNAAWRPQGTIDARGGWLGMSHTF